MNNRFKLILVIEGIILLGLLIHVVKSPHFFPFILLAIIFSSLALLIKSRFFRTMSVIFLVITALLLLTMGWFWLALLFPLLAFFWLMRRGGFAQSGNYYQNENQNYESYEDHDDEGETVNQKSGNDIIDLALVDFKAEGNHLSIKKISGNTKIIVPEDVALILEASTKSGIIKIFNLTPVMNTQTRYFSENTEEAEKKISIKVQVQTGNIEVVAG
ncbi:MAG: cell wall-active antibiotics response protein LiaF [Streptococcaceae bacterium]|nr:cell wall-active antibiotics response protein LiaF [Streptococcaceae bacterium]